MSYKVITHDALCVAAARWLHRHNDNCNIPNCFLCAVDVSFWTIYKERPDVVNLYQNGGRVAKMDVETSTMVHARAQSGIYKQVIHRYFIKTAENA